MFVFFTKQLNKFPDWKLISRKDDVKKALKSGPFCTNGPKTMLVLIIVELSYSIIIINVNNFCNAPIRFIITGINVWYFVWEKIKLVTARVIPKLAPFVRRV